MDFTWDQTYDEVSVTIPINEEVHSQDIQILVKEKHFKVLAKEKIILEGVLYSTVYHETTDIMWYIEDGKIYITFTKIEKYLWESFFEDGEKIDLEQLRNEKIMPMDHLDEETRQEVAKLMSSAKNKNKE